MQAEAAVADALEAGKALCKFISPNDAGATGTHQCGFYLPKQAWRLFTSHPPRKGVNHKAMVEILWPESIVTQSAITWYGQKTRSEYRLTRFGRSFPWLRSQYIGCLLVLIPFSLTRFHAYVLETDDEIETFQDTLGVETFGEWGVFSGGKPQMETEDECLERVFGRIVQQLTEFPDGIWMAGRARLGTAECQPGISDLSADEKLLKWVTAEYRLFRGVESKLCLPIVQRPFRSVDEFVDVAASILQRRKSRAGHSLEQHVEQVLREARIPFDMQARIDGKVRPDILIPSKAAYENPSFPTSRLLVVGVKRTCKDRWRQVLNEGKRVREKHLLTLQEAISPDQLKEMRDARVTLVVPRQYHRGYDVGNGITLLTVDEFITKARNLTS